jgi:carbamoyl-phosphate synthase large subunit
MNVLLTCAGRRNYLVQYFREALAGSGLVLATDASPDAPAMAEADLAFTVPKVHDPTYFDVLLEIAATNRVGLLISLNDLELPYLAREKSRFLSVGTIPVVSDPRVIDTCFDKDCTAKFLTGIGVDVPKTYLTLEDACAALSRGEISFPVVVKPRWGTASIGIEYPQDRRELEIAYELVHRRLRRTILAEVSATDAEHCVLIQERLGGQEHGLDIVCDLQGRYVTTFVKRKLSMRAGETDRAETVASPELEAVGARIASQLKHTGNLDCDAFLSPGGVNVLELNPRFGGGYPFSHVAGANLPAALLAWANHETPNPEWLRVRPGVRSAKCDRLVVSAVAGPAAASTARSR